MVKRNQGWERRVEITEIRRTETKLRKQRTADKRQHKVMAQDLLALVDRHASRLFRIQLWTDGGATASAPLLEALSRADASDKRRGRSGSLHELEDSFVPKGSNLLTGLRSNPKSNRKGARVRSNSVNETNDEGAAAPVLMLCKAHFFTGKCQDVKGKKGGCRYHHYCAPYKTLNDVLKQRNSHIGEMEEVLQLAADGNTGDDLQAIEMVHYLPMDLGLDSAEDVFISEEITNQLAAHETKPANIVYAVVNDKLIFDRYQEGLLVNDRGFIAILSGEQDTGRPRLSIDEQERLEETLISLPGSILEHTLTFLPDAAVAIATQVCKAWYQEIGRSPNIWREMLQRRSWPIPQTLLAHDDDTAEESNRDVYREAFIGHYTAVRDMKAIRLALHALETRKLQPEKEMCYQDFSTRKFSPALASHCAGVHVWAPNQVLVGYSLDCSIRLFECVSRDAEEKLCRELICQSINPYKNTKKRSSVLVSLDVDQYYIGGLCQVNADNVDTEAWVLVVVNRDDFLQGQSSAVMEKVGTSYDDRQLKVIDVGESVLNFLLSSDVVDHRLLQIIDFLATGGQVGDIEVLVSHSLAACGDGRFMVEVAISIPAPAEEDIDLDMLLVDRKLVLFSASAGAIVWMGESNDVSRGMRPRHENMSLHHTRRRVPGGSRQFCHVVVSSPVAPDLLLGSIEPTGHVQATLPIEGSNAVRLDMLVEEWQLVIRAHRPIVMTRSDIIAADVVYRTGNDRIRMHKSILSVYPLHPVDNDTLYRTIVLEGNLEVMRLVNFSEQHVIALCREYHPCLPDELDGAAADDEEEPELMESRVTLCAICIHIVTGCEIYRVTLLDHLGPDLSDIPVISGAQGSTIGIGFACKGVIMTGNDVRSVVDGKVVVLEDLRSAQKKKKKKTPSKSYRKDAFMRGMSLRG